MALNKRSKWLVSLLPLFVVTAAEGAPTICNYNSNIVQCAQSTPSDAHISLVPEINQFTAPCDYQLAGIAAEFLKPPVGFTDSLSLPIHAKPLPAVPAAFFMALIGFICVSLVKDRRVWIAALTGLLWAGQTGIGAIPQLALGLSHGNRCNKRFSAEVAYSNYILNSDRQRSDTEGTRYIGLLRHLEGIPTKEKRPHVKRGAKYLAPPLRRGLLQFEVPQLAIIKLLPEIILPTNCLALRAEQFICFSPAFIFENLPRGPPIQA